MRKTKFRVWDKELNKMFYTDTIQFDNGLFFGIDGHFDDEEPAWMQYTGLKDKHGKEIYEGDIIKIPEGTSYKYYFVIWSKNRLGFTLNNGVGFGLTYGIEIVGNIYENTELLGRI